MKIVKSSQREKRNLFLIDICTKSVEIDSTISKRERRIVTKRIFEREETKK